MIWGAALSCASIRCRPVIIASMTTSAATAVESVPALLHRRRDDPGVAHRVKRLGLWREISWKQYAASVTQLAAFLVAQDVVKGDRIALLSENCPEWLVSDLAIQSAAAITVGVYATSSAEQLLYGLRHSGACGLILEDAEQLEKWLAIRDLCPQVRFVVSIERSDGVDGITDWDEALTAGTAQLNHVPGCVAERCNALTHDDVALFIYTSGTTGEPKAAMLTHGNLLSAVQGSTDDFASVIEDINDILGDLDINPL